MPTELQLRKRVGRGIRLLNKVKPGWHRKVKLSKLSMNSCSMCILGQVYGFFFDAVDTLKLVKGDEPRCTAAAPYGFSFNAKEWVKLQDKPVLAFVPLTNIWKEEIRKLKAS